MKWMVLLFLLVLISGCITHEKPEKIFVSFNESDFIMLLEKPAMIKINCTTDDRIFDRLEIYFNNTKKTIRTCHGRLKPLIRLRKGVYSVKIRAFHKTVGAEVTTWKLIKSIA